MDNEEDFGSFDDDYTDEDAEELEMEMFRRDLMEELRLHFEN